MKFTLEQIEQAYEYLNTKEYNRDHNTKPLIDIINKSEVLREMFEMSGLLARIDLAATLPTVFCVGFETAIQATKDQVPTKTNGTVTYGQLLDVDNSLPDSGTIGEAVGFPKSELTKVFDRIFEGKDVVFGTHNDMLRLGLSLGYLYGKGQHENTSEGTSEGAGNPVSVAGS